MTQQQPPGDPEVTADQEEQKRELEAYAREHVDPKLAQFGVVGVLVDDDAEKAKSALAMALYGLPHLPAWWHCELDLLRGAAVVERAAGLASELDADAGPRVCLILDRYFMDEHLGLMPWDLDRRNDAKSASPAAVSMRCAVVAAQKEEKKSTLALLFLTSLPRAGGRWKRSDGIDWDRRDLEALRRFRRRLRDESSRDWPSVLTYGGVPHWSVYTRRWWQVCTSVAEGSRAGDAGSEWCLWGDSLSSEDRRQTDAEHFATVFASWTTKRPMERQSFEQLRRPDEGHADTGGWKHAARFNWRQIVATRDIGRARAYLYETQPERLLWRHRTVTDLKGRLHVPLHRLLSMREALVEPQVAHTAQVLDDLARVSCKANQLLMVPNAAITAIHSALGSRTSFVPEHTTIVGPDAESSWTALFGEAPQADLPHGWLNGDVQSFLHDAHACLVSEGHRDALRTLREQAQVSHVFLCYAHRHDFEKALKLKRVLEHVGVHVLWAPADGPELQDSEDRSWVSWCQWATEEAAAYVVLLGATLGKTQRDELALIAAAKEKESKQVWLLQTTVEDPAELEGLALPEQAHRDQFEVAEADGFSDLIEALQPLTGDLSAG